MKKLVFLLILALILSACSKKSDTESESDSTESISETEAISETEPASESEEEKSESESETAPPAELKFDSFASLRYPDSNLVLTPSVAVRVSSIDDIPAPLPTAVIVKYEFGVAAGTDIPSLMAVLDGKSMPIFEVSTSEDAENLMIDIDSYCIKDYFILSESGDILKYASETDSNSRGILDRTSVTSLDGEKMLELRREVGKSYARILLLSENAADRKHTREIEKMLIPVWVDGGETDTETELVKMITAGASGIVTSSPSALEAAYVKYFPKNTLASPLFVIGHRGIPSRAPENTIVSALMAYDYGAEIIENDIYLSKDGEIVVMHDSTVDRTTNGTGTVEEMTLDELKKLRVSKKFGDKYPDAEIPTLAEYFEAFKDNDGMICIEIKSQKAEALEKMLETVRKYDFESRVFAITFHKKQIAEMKRIAPEIPVGLLDGTATAPTARELSKRLAEINKAVGEAHTIYNPHPLSINEEIVKALTARGIVVCPYGLNDTKMIYKYIFWGSSGIATDNADELSDFLHGIEVSEKNHSVKAGESVTIEASIARYDRKAHEISDSELSVSFIEGADIAKAEISGGNVTVTASEKGKVSFILTYSAKAPAGTEYTVVSEPIVITAE